MTKKYQLGDDEYEADSEEEIREEIISSGKIISSPSTILTALDSNGIIAPIDKAVVEFEKKTKRSGVGNTVSLGKPAILQAWIEAEDLAYKLYTDRHLYENGWEQQTPILIRTFRKDGFSYDDIEYQVKKIKTEEGLYAFILKPINVPRGAIPEVKVLFTGTTDRAGGKRDLESKAAGHQSFKREKHNLMAELNAVVEEIEGENVKISVIGHSLGGIDALRLALKITQAVAEKLKSSDVYSFFKEAYYKIANSSKDNQTDSKKANKPNPSYEGLTSKKIDLHIVASEAPKSTKKQSQKFADNLQIATSGDTDNPLKVEATIFNIQEDIVPLFGEQNMLIQKTSDGTKSVLSMMDATVVSVKTNSFNHSINFYHNPEHPEVHEIEILRIEKGAPDPNMEKKIADRLNKGIPRFIFENTIKKIIDRITIHLGWGEVLNSDPQPAPAIPTCA